MTTSRVDLRSGVPLHVQVREAIRRQAHDGSFVDKTGRLMTEAQLVKHFGVSRITIRHAIQPLVDEGLFARERGKGTFLRSNRPEHWIGRLMGFTETIRDAGSTPGARILKKGVTHRPPADIRERLRCEAPWQLKRVRLADDMPIAIEHAYYPADIGAALETHDLVSIAMYRVFEEELRLRIGEAKQTIGATLADAGIARLLGVECGNPLLSMERLTLSRDDRPLELLRSVYLPDHFRFSITLVRQGA